MYEFNYNSIPDSMDYSNYHDAIDHWGYYNGYTSNTVYHPAFGGRETNERTTMIGTLANIQYPTGGVTMFEWEQNDYGFINGVSIGGQTVNETHTSDYRMYGSVQNMNQLNSSSVQTYQFDKALYFTKPLDHIRKITIDVRTFMGNLINSGSGMANCTDYYYHHDFTDLNSSAPRVELISPSNELVQVWFIDQYQSSQMPIPFELTENGTYTVRLRFPFNWMTGANNSFEPQTVFDYLVPGGTENTNGDNGYVSITQTDILSHYESNPKWGGLRIKKISSVSEYLSDAVEKNYSYVQSWGSSASSGVVIEHPKDNYQSEHYSCKVVATLPSSYIDFQWTTYSTSHSDALYSTPLGGSRIEYSTVYEWFTGDSTYIRYDFTSQINDSCRDKLDCNFPSYINGGAEMRTSYKHKSGNLTTKTIYSDNKILKKELYEFNIKENNDIPVFLDGLHPLVNIDDCNLLVTSGNDTYSSDYVACRYKIIPYTKTISSMTTEEYDAMIDETNIPHMTSTNNYTYFINTFNDDPSATLVRSKSHQNSDGSESETFFSYININGHFINLPETEVTVCDGRIVKAKKYVYDDKCRLIATYRSPTNIPVRNEYCLDSYYFGASQELLSAINLPEFSYKYNLWGELVEVDYNGKVLSSFIWAYRGSHPVAEVKGVSYEELLQASPDGLFILDLHNRYDISESELDAIRQAFPSNEVVTLTYDWLVGVGTMTTPNRVTTKFSYDGFGRLESIKDLNDYYIKRFEYHYAD